MPPSVLIVTKDRLGEMLGGAAIRAYEIARSLTGVAEVTLAAPGLRRRASPRPSTRPSISAIHAPLRASSGRRRW